MEARLKQETTILVLVIGAMAFAAIANFYFHLKPVEGFEVTTGERGFSWIVAALVSLAISAYLVIRSATVFGKLFWASGIVFSLTRFIVVFAVSPELERIALGALLSLLAVGNSAIWLMAVRTDQNVFSFHGAKGT